MCLAMVYFNDGNIIYLPTYTITNFLVSTIKQEMRDFVVKSIGDDAYNRT